MGSRVRIRLFHILHFVRDLSFPLLKNSEGHFPLGGIFRAERQFLLFKDQLAESGRQKAKENIIPRGKFRLVENGPKPGVDDRGHRLHELPTHHGACHQGN